MIAHLNDHASPAAAWSLAGGVALYLLGEAWFRAATGIGRRRGRLLVAALALPTALIGLEAGGLWQLLVLVALLIGMLVAEGRPQHRSRA